MSGSIPAEVEGWIDRERYAETANFPVERGYCWTSLASVENGNPLFWDDAVADELTGGPIAPPTTLSLWFRPHAWEPGQATQRLPLQVHFDLKDRLGLPEAVMTDNEVVFHTPVRPGDIISMSQVLRSVSDPKTTKLGTGRFWVIDVDYRNQDGDRVGVEIFTGFGYRRADKPSATSTRAARAVERPEPELVEGELPTLRHPVTATTVVLGALATRDWRPMHHDVDFAVNRNGTRDIFLNTPNQQAWFERFVTDWSGPRGRLGHLQFRMIDSIYPKDLMTVTGRVTDDTTDATGCRWATVAIQVWGTDTSDDGTDADARLCTTATVRIALPTTADDNPWRRTGDQWQP